jgi:electron transfer flavoprotein beta subunit
MKVAVCVKHIPDGRLRLDPGSARLDRGGPGDLNSVDRYALEEALRLKDSGVAEEVVVLSMGPEPAVETIRTALGLGADRGVLASDPAAAGSDLLGTSRILANLIAAESPDIAFFGQQTTDGGGAVMWAAVADRLRMPFVSQVSSIALEGSTVRVGRQTEAGDEVVEVPTPALISVSDSINEPRYASLKGMMAAKRKPLEIKTVADLGLDVGAVGEAGAMTTVLSIGPPPARAEATRIDDEATAAERIVEFLSQRELL